MTGKCKKTEHQSAALALALITIALSSGIASAQSGTSSQTFQRYYGADDLANTMEQAPATAGAFEKDLFRATGDPGLCPGWFGGFARFAANFNRLCGRDQLLEATRSRYKEFEDCADQFGKGLPADSLESMRKCRKVTDAIRQVQDGRAILAGNTEGMDKETKARHDKLESSVKGFLKEIAVCTIKAGITAADMPQSRRRDWEQFVDGLRVVETGLAATDTLYSLAEKVAKDGRSAFLDGNVPADMFDWDEALRDPAKWVGGKIEGAFSVFGTAADQVRTLVTSFPIVRDHILTSEADTVSSELQSCRFDEAEKNFEVTELKMKAAILRHRRDMAFYRGRTICSWNKKQLDGSSAFRQAEFLRPANSVSPYELWDGSRKSHDILISAYQEFRRNFRPVYVTNRKRAFERLVDAKLGDLKKAVDDSIKACGRAGEALPLDTLQDAIWERSRSSDMAALTECRSEFQKRASRLGRFADTFATMSNRARAANALLKACKIAPARKFIQEEINALQPPAADSSSPIQVGLRACWGGGPRAALDRLERRNKALQTRIRSIDGFLQQLQRKAMQCDGKDIDPLNERIRQELDALECPGGHEVIASRKKRLEGLNVHLGDPDCQVMEAPPEFATVAIRISGSGYTPHYAAGSYILDGHHDVRLTIPYGKPPLAALGDYRERYNSDPCEAEVPAIPGLSKIPVLFNGKPGISVVTAAHPGRYLAEGIDLQNTWKAADQDGPPLSELRPKSCR